MERDGRTALDHRARKRNKKKKKTEERIITNKQKEQNVFNEYDKTHLGTMSFTTIIYLKIV